MKNKMTSNSRIKLKNGQINEEDDDDNLYYQIKKIKEPLNELQMISNSG